MPLLLKLISSSQLREPMLVRIPCLIAIGCLLLCLAGCGGSDSKSKTAKTASEKSSAEKLAGEIQRPKGSDSKVRWGSHSQDVGVDFTYRNGEQSWQYLMLEANGGGVGMLDFDRDGDLDLFFPGGGDIASSRSLSAVEHHLYRSLDKWKYEDRSAATHASRSTSYSFGVSVGDYDNDGFQDILVVGYGGLQLLRNLGDGTFIDVADEHGLSNKHWNSSSAWCDIDNDGSLDAYVSHYAQWDLKIEKDCFARDGKRDRCVPADYQGEADQLWRQTGDGRFEDRSDAVAANPSRGLGVAAVDFDTDGDVDLYVANDVHANLYFRNDGNLKLEEIGTRSGTALGSRGVVDGSMGIAVGDWDGNLTPDFLVTNYQEEYCELYSNQGKNYFKLSTRGAGMMTLGTRNVAWGTSFLDADHDGDEDLLIVAGHTSRNPSGSTNKQLPYYLDNMQQQRFVSVGGTAGPFFEENLPARGLAVGDLDQDGDLDAVVSLLEEPSRILENETQQKGRYLQIDLVGTTCNRDAIGAFVEATTGTKKRVRHRYGGGSIFSSNALTLHFGLGDAKKVDELVVHWPGGKITKLSEIDVDQRLVIVEP